MSDDTIDSVIGRRSGQFLFALILLLVAAFLLSQLGEQTVWKAKTKLYAQPAFWPATSLGCMTLFAALYAWRLPLRRVAQADWREGLTWLRPAEFALWFMVYVWATPIIGFLPASMIFAPALSWRMGYRDRRIILASTLFGALVVIGFKGFLSVKIPGAAIYEYLPGGLRSFFILNL